MPLYEVLFYDGDAPIPAYYLIDGVEDSSPEEAVRNHLAEITEKVRSCLSLCPDLPDHKIHQSLYLVQENGLVRVR